MKDAIQDGAIVMTIKKSAVVDFALLNFQKIYARDVFCTCKVLGNSYHFGNSRIPQKSEGMATLVREGSLQGCCE
jgi:hypothetical protein